jgi:hypothetical protein
MSDLETLVLDMVQEFPGLVLEEDGEGYPLEVSGADLVEWLCSNMAHLPELEKAQAVAAARAGVPSRE